MGFEFWWLLGFPLFFLLGWATARIDLKELMTESRTLPASYFKGLNFLLNEQPDKALETLLEVAKNDPQTTELQFALGNLFRRRGEVDRAIKMHQNLLDRPDLGKSQRAEALYELGQDYFKAGFLDRAEQLFSKLVGTSLEGKGYQFLVDIYEQEKDWNKAVTVARKIQKLVPQNKSSDIAHYFCELASLEKEKANYSRAQSFLTRALEENTSCVRASILLGDIMVLRENHEDAITHWKKIEFQNSDYLALVSERLLHSYTSLNSVEQGLDLLSNYLGRYPSYELLNTILMAEFKHRGYASAYALVRREISKLPSLHTLNKLLELQLLQIPKNEVTDLELIKSLIEKYTNKLGLYFCNNCGFKAANFHWHCPACNAWDTYSPRRFE